MYVQYGTYACITNSDNYYELSDEDGEEVNLIESWTRYLLSEKETSVQESIQQEFNGQVTKAHKIIWKVKFDFEEKNCQEDEKHFDFF